MATLPADRTKLSLAQSNENPGIAAGSSVLKNTLTEAYDTIDLLNQKVDANVGAATLVPYPPAQYNQFINGNFDTWQRLPAGQTSFSNPASGSYTADKYQVTYDGSIGTFTVSKQAFTVGQSAVPNNPQFFYRWDQTVAGSGSTFRSITTKIEGVRNFAGQVCTKSFWLKADSNRVVSAALRQNFGTGGTPSAQVDTASTNLNLTTSWQKFTVTFTLSSISGKILGTNGDDCLQLLLGLPINTIMTIDIAQVQSNAGNIALPFQPKSIGDNIKDSQRYAIGLTSSDANASIGIGYALNTTSARIIIMLPSKMRVIPTLIATAIDWQLTDGSTLYDLTAISLTSGGNSDNIVTLLCTVASGLTAFRPYSLISKSANKLMLFDAEI